MTLNVGLLDYNLCCGITAFSNPPFSKERLPYLPDDIASLNPDILAIQECYYEVHVDYICDRLKDILPYSARKLGKKMSCLNLSNGMLILSKFPISNVDLICHNTVACVEDWFGDKCTLIATVEIPGLGKMTIVNVHPTAGGRDPESEKADDNRECTLQQIMDYYQHLMQSRQDSSEYHGAVILGDYNCGPDVSPRNFEYMISRGFRDTFQEAVAANVVAGELRHTWDPRLVLSSSGPHAHQQPQRIDHIMIPSSDPVFGKVSHAEVVLFKEKVPIVVKGKPRLCSVSDHYGLVTDIEIIPPNTV